METSNLRHGKYYQFNEPCTGRIERVTYMFETLNHHVFKGEKSQIRLTFTSVITNIIEIPEIL